LSCSSRLRWSRLFGMCRFVFAVIFSAALISSASKAQSQSSIPQFEATATKLSDPVYPPLARQARIQGAVRLNLHLHNDGTVQSAEVMDGHPMLIVAAMESAKKSQFDCGGCEETTFIYDFEIRDGCHFGPRCTSSIRRRLSSGRRLGMFSFLARPAVNVTRR
jgi:TonB family protein